MANKSTAEQLLSFQEYSHDGTARIEVEPIHAAFGNNLTNNSLSDLMVDMQGSKILTENTPPNPEQTTKSFLSIEYYQQFFDVNSMDVVDRIATSMIPRRASPNYLTNIEAKPDLYGPFWIVVTLIFTIAISGNLSKYLQHADVNYHWRYDFHLVSYAATAIVCYAVFVPMALWGCLKWSAKPVDPDGIEETSMPSMLSLLCVYGYSLAIYIPVSILWSIQISLLQWLLVITAAFLSGSVLVYLLSPSLRRTSHSLPLMGIILFLHFLLATGFMLYFFHVPKSYAVISPDVKEAVVSFGNKTISD